VSGTCVWCIAKQLDYETKVISNFRDLRQKPIVICSGPICTFGPGGVKHRKDCPEAGKEH
jgi:hypothetical protein